MRHKETELTLAIVAADPDVVTTHFVIRAGEEVTFRPLVPEDEDGLTAFVESLCESTRRFWWIPSYDSAGAREMCEAINRYDKLRMVAVVAEHVVALFEFSLAITDGDRELFRGYGVTLDEKTDVRFGPCIADAYQNRGMGSQLLRLMVDVAQRFGKKRMILWGGVFEDNHRAIRYYQKNGFQIESKRLNDDGRVTLDAIIDLA